MKFFSLDVFILLLFFFFGFFLRSYIVMCDTLICTYGVLATIHTFYGQKEKTQQRVCFVSIYEYIDKEAEVHTSFHL